jgi:hypothetical protein
MAKFSDVIQGTRARKPIKLPLPGAQIDGETGAWLGPVVDLLVRPLRDDEHALVLAKGLAFARKHGLQEPGAGDPLYEKGVMIETLALTCLDSESPTDGAPVFFFDGVDAATKADIGAFEQIHRSEVMTPEIIAYLYMQQQLFQDEVNPLLKSMSPSEFMAAAIKTAQGDMSFFVHSRPGMQWSFLLTTVKQLLSALSLNSTFSTSSEPLTPTQN